MLVAIAYGDSLLVGGSVDEPAEAWWATALFRIKPAIWVVGFLTKRSESIDLYTDFLNISGIRNLPD